MDNITAAVEDFLRRKEVKHEPTEFPGVFKLGFVGECLQEKRQNAYEENSNNQ